MQVVGVGAPGTPVVVSLPVGHGEDPAILLWRAGWPLVRWLSVRLGVADEVVVTAQVRQGRPGEEPPSPQGRGREADLGPLTVPPVVKQRLASYAIAISDRGLLATKFARSVGSSTTWGLPGGGRDAGELPADTVLRELVEETGQVAHLGRLVDIRSDHWVGRSPAGVVEDFHALRLIYSARVPDPTDPVVNDVGGTTAAAAWIALDRWRSLPWALGSRTILERHLDDVVAGRE